MTEYIDRAAVLKCIEEDGYEDEYDLGYYSHNREFQVLIEEIPAADVKLVVRGKWVPKNTDGSWRVDTCSACKKDTHYVRYAPAYDFCPNCGADMREG